MKKTIVSGLAFAALLGAGAVAAQGLNAQLGVSADSAAAKAQAAQAANDASAKVHADAAAAGSAAGGLGDGLRSTTQQTLGSARSTAHDTASHTRAAVMSSKDAASAKVKGSAAQVHDRVQAVGSNASDSVSSAVSARSAGLLNSGVSVNTQAGVAATSAAPK